MTYSRSKNTSDFEKKLEKIRLQLYGKDSPSKSEVKLTKPSSFEFTTSPKLATKTNKEDVHYLKNDLIKIFLLATIAIATQLLLFFGLKQGVIKF